MGSRSEAATEARKAHKEREVMPKTPMCTNRACPAIEDCYLFRAVPDLPRQNYVKYQPNEVGDCEDYIPIEGRLIAEFTEN